METLARRIDAGTAVLASTTLLSWLMLALGRSALTVVPRCFQGAPWSARFPLPLGLVFMLNPLHQLLLEAMVMVLAMMVPLTIPTLRHVRARTFASRRSRVTFLFLGGYLGVWTLIAVVLECGALTVLSALPSPALCLALSAVIAVSWQFTPVKQWCLNRCHRRPSLAAFGAAADRDAFAFGVAFGAACAGTCWALMLLPLLMHSGHLLTMLAVTGFLWAERLEPSGPLRWRSRGVGRSLRIVIGQIGRLSVRAG